MTSTETIRVTQPRELLALIPFQLGFTPTDSLVVVSLREPRGRVGLIARIDLADAAQAADTLAHHLADDGAARAVVVTYTGDPGAAHTATTVVTDALSHDLACCPVAGRPLSDLTGTQVAATLTYAGVSPAATRAGLEVQPAPAAARRAANQAGSRWLRTHAPHATSTRTAGLTAWCAATATTGPVAPALLGAIAAALTDVVLRDAVLTSLIPDVDPDLPAQVLTGQGNADLAQALRAIMDAATGVRPGPAAEAAEHLLEDVAAHAASTRTAAPTTLLALLAWWSGDGARAGVLLDQALTCDPTHRLALLLQDALSAGLAPGWVRRTT
ncbi:MAG: DUF4192 domain-containing protein [Cellulomonas sp.]